MLARYSPHPGPLWWLLWHILPVGWLWCGGWRARLLCHVYEREWWRSDGNLVWLLSYSPFGLLERREH